MLGKIAAIAVTAAAVTACTCPEPEKRPEIICFGDSLTACGGENGRYSDMLQDSLPDCLLVNRGIGGDTIAGALARLEEDVISCKGDYLVIGIGANDYWQRSRPLCELENDYRQIIDRCHAAGMKIVIISCFGNESLPPGVQINVDEPGIPLEHYAVGIAAFERKIAAEYQAEYVPDMQCGILPKGREDLWADSNHPNAAGNRIVADTILPALLKIMGRQ